MKEDFFEGADNEKDVIKTESGFLIVGLGASAGGVQALKTFFENVPDNPSMAFVVILHLSPDHDSKLAEVLQIATAMPVSQVTEKTKITANHVYVVPPNRHLSMVGNFIEVSDNVAIEDRRAPVDIFFRTLAESHGNRGVCVILSGTGANGSMGLKRVKEKGGVVYVQSPLEAEFNEMPRNSIETALVDQILPVAEIPKHIIAYQKNLASFHISIDPESKVEDQQIALQQVFAQIRVHTGHDFSNYKRPTLLRRIERRINVNSLSGLTEYAEFLQKNDEEIKALLKDLLISVTNFFRDKKSFGAIETDVIPAIINGKTAANQIRVWIAGCATGEEAYSLAMMLAERTIGAIDAPKVQIFATDIDETAIATAREGLYTINDAADVSPERLRRFFFKEADGYRIRQEIREMILLANHNFIKDPPFSRLDMITCRNVLIYFNQTAQQRALETFHFALRPGGFLFLGSAESVNGAHDLYSALNRDEHIFQSRHVTARNYPMPESVPRFRFDQSLHLQGPKEKEERTLDRVPFGKLHQRLLEAYAPPSVLIDEEHDIVHMSENVGRYFEISGGEPTQSLLKLIRPELRLELRSALYQAVKQQTELETKDLKLVIGDRTQTIRIKVRPIMSEIDNAKGFLLVVFEQKNDEPGKQGVTISADEPLAKQLEEELIRLKAQLRDSIEQHEFQAEELKASNEELQAINEELRSASEELETSKEELQSINEELRTVNQELKVKIEEISITSNNLQNLINSANIGTIFLDRSFRIKLFTPAVRDLFNLIAADHGRPITDITSVLEYENLLQDAETVLEKLTVIEREVKTTNHSVFMMRILPYRTTEDRINGVVITFFDITKRKEAEDLVAQDLYNTRLLRDLGARMTTEENIQVLNKEIMAAAMTMLHANAGTVHIMDDTTQELVLLASQGFEESLLKKVKRVKAGPTTPCGITMANNERSLLFDSPADEGHDTSFCMPIVDGFKTAQSTPLVSRDGQPIGMISTYWQGRNKPTERELRFLDLLARQAADLIGHRQAEERLKQAMDIETVGVMFFKPNGEMTGFNNAFLRMSGYTREELQVGDVRWDEQTPPEFMPEHLQKINEFLKTGRILPYERVLLRKDGSLMWVLFSATHLKGGGGVGFMIEINERKVAENALRQSELRLRTLSDVVPQIIWANDKNGKPNYFNERWYEYSGLTEEASLAAGWEVLLHPEDEKSATAAWQNALETGKVFDAEYRLRRADGTYCWHIGRSVPLKNEDGNVVGWFGSATEIENLKEVETAFRRTADRLQLALEAGQMGSFEHDLKTDRIAATEQHMENFGFTAKRDFTYREFIASVLPEDIAELEEQYKKAMEASSIYDAEFRVRLKDGTLRWLRSAGRTVFDEKGKPEKMVGITLDITEQKIFTEELSKQVSERTAELKRSNDDLLQFAHVASHDLKEPVRKIKTFNTRLIDEYGYLLPEKGKGYLERVEKAATRMFSMIEGILNYSLPIMSEKSFMPVDLNETITQIESDLEVVILKKGAAITNSGLPTINANGILMYQLFYNLINNSLKFSREDKPSQINIASEQILKDDKVFTKITLSDNGIGFDKEFSKKIFEIFSRLNPADKYEGTGLGLALCKKIVDRHHGEIFAFGEQNNGAIFVIILPIDS